MLRFFPMVSLIPILFSFRNNSNKIIQTWGTWKISKNLRKRELEHFSLIRRELGGFTTLAWLGGGGSVETIFGRGCTPSACLEQRVDSELPMKNLIRYVLSFRVSFSLYMFFKVPVFQAVVFSTNDKGKIRISFGGSEKNGYAFCQLCFFIS